MLTDLMEELAGDDGRAGGAQLRQVGPRLIRNCAEVRRQRFKMADYSIKEGGRTFFGRNGFHLVYPLEVKS